MKPFFAAVAGVTATCLVSESVDSQEVRLAPAVWMGTVPDGHGLQHVSRYRDNPDYIVERRRTPQFNPIGELETLQSDAGGQKFYGTAFIISPCYALTAYHNVFFDGKAVPGKDYSQVLRIGLAPRSDVAFLGHTLVTPVIWGGGYKGDWALLKMKTCIGARSDIGWMEFSKGAATSLVGQPMAVAGFSGNSGRGALSLGLGRVIRLIGFNGYVVHSASSSPGQSGGPVMIRENGKVRVVGIDVREWFAKEDTRRSGVYDTFIDGNNWNEFVTLQHIFSDGGQRAELSDDEWRKMAAMAADDMRADPSTSAEMLVLGPGFQAGLVASIIARDRARLGANPAERHMSADWPVPVKGTPQPY